MNIFISVRLGSLKIESCIINILNNLLIILYVCLGYECIRMFELWRYLFVGLDHACICIYLFICIRYVTIFCYTVFTIVCNMYMEAERFNPVKKSNINNVLSELQRNRRKVNLCCKYFKGSLNFRKR